MTDEQLERALTVRERERRNALVGDDMAALADLMTDDLIHVHTTGNAQDKAELLSHAGSFLRFVEVERGPLQIRRIADDAAIMTGTMTNTLKRRGFDERITVRAFVTQVWVRQGETWRTASFQATRLPNETGSA